MSICLSFTIVSAAVSPTGALRQASESLMVESVLAGSASPVLALQPSPAGAGLNSNLRSKRARRASSTRDGRRRDLRSDSVTFDVSDRVGCHARIRPVLLRGGAQPLPEPFPDIAEEAAPLHLLYRGVGRRYSDTRSPWSGSSGSGRPGRSAVRPRGRSCSCR